MVDRVDLIKLLKSKVISQRTYDKVIIAKQLIERKYNLKNIKNIEMNSIFSKIDSLNISTKKKEQKRQEILSQEAAKYRKLREKQTIRDYNSIAIIGRGAFGEVHVCCEKKTGQIVAVKKIRKDVLMMKNQVIHTRNEQLFMSKVKSPWIVELKASFQEDDFLYLVMEYLPGGDFMNLLIKKDILTEEEARFYLAELILAIESIHKLDCIHRDIKPDNILIDKTGHIKLSDFGLAKVSEKIFDLNNNINGEYKSNSHQKNYSCVGTAYYVAPEVLNKKGYGPEIDWWSVGVIFFEMLIGYAPFCSKHTNEVCQKVLNWKKFLKIPSKKKVSKDAEDLIFKLINNPNERLGIRGADEIKKHPFFKGVNWDNIRDTKAPFVPKLKNDYDTTYFETMEIKEPFYPPINNKKVKRKDVEFLGYTFKEEDFKEINIENEIQNSNELTKYINRDKSNGESFEHSSNSNSNIENGGKDKCNGIDEKINNISIHLEKEFDSKKNDDNKILKTKKLFNKSKNKNNKIQINNDNDSKNIINNINKQNNILQTISYIKSIQNQNNYTNQNNIPKKFKRKIDIQINNINNNNPINNSNNSQKGECITDRNTNNKNIKTEPNNINIINNEHIIHNYLEYNNNLNKYQNYYTKLNVIQLPKKKNIKEKISKKIIIPENGATKNTSNSNDKYILKKNLVIQNINRERYIPYRLSPQPNIPKKYLITKNKQIKNNEINNDTTTKSLEKGIFKRYLLKGVINQNAFIKKKIENTNSAKSIFIKNNNTKNNSLNNSVIIRNNEIYCDNYMTERKNTLNNSKASYIYKKKL